MSWYFRESCTGKHFKFRLRTETGSDALLSDGVKCSPAFCFFSCGVKSSETGGSFPVKAPLIKRVEISERYFPPSCLPQHVSRYAGAVLYWNSSIDVRDRHCGAAERQQTDPCKDYLESPMHGGWHERTWCATQRQLAVVVAGFISNCRSRRRVVRRCFDELYVCSA